MKDEDFTRFESEILAMMLAGKHPVLETLREQLRHARVTGREYTGVGFFTTMQVDCELSQVLAGAPQLVFGDVDADIPSLEYPASFLVFVTDGYLDCLEGFSCDEPWRLPMVDFKLSYRGGSRKVDGLGLGPAR